MRSLKALNIYLCLQYKVLNSNVSLVVTIVRCTAVTYTLVRMGKLT